MIQFYFLSVFLNVLAGIALVSADYPEGGAPLPGLRSFLRGDSFSLAAGTLSIATGIFKFLTPVEGDIPVIGDILPALSGLASGFSLLLGYYSAKSAVASKTMENLKKIFIEKRRTFGIIGISAGILHFVFPRIVLL
jgi:hypothetical protein